MTTRQRERYAYICHPKKRDLASYDSLEIAQRHQVSRCTAQCWLRQTRTPLNCRETSKIWQ